jgi:hypothetical protein
MTKKEKHKIWRKEFNEVCLKRDGHKCVFCDEKRTKNLNVHHITDRHDIPNGGYVESNGITVCEEHHLLCEEYHKTNECLPEYHPFELYKKINSSPEMAYRDSVKLNEDESEGQHNR